MKLISYILGNIAPFVAVGTRDGLIHLYTMDHGELDNILCSMSLPNGHAVEIQVHILPFGGDDEDGVSTEVTSLCGNPYIEGGDDLP